MSHTLVAKHSFSLKFHAILNSILRPITLYIIRYTPPKVSVFVCVSPDEVDAGVPGSGKVQGTQCAYRVRW